VWRKCTGCTGLFPSEEEAPLYAESMVASAAMHTKPGTANHLLRKFIRESWYKGELIGRLCEEFHKRPNGGKMSGQVLQRKVRITAANLLPFPS
jgi:hypothetical protein